jgi:hypothetical protein
MIASSRGDDTSIAIRGPLRSANVEKPIEGFARDGQLQSSVFARIDCGCTCAEVSVSQSDKA